MAKCDNKSVGVIIQNDMGDFLLLKRMKKPFGWAPVAGHLDDDGNNFDVAGKREAFEEVGIRVLTQHCVLDRVMPNEFDNECRRGGGEGPWHHWQVFKADKWSGEIKRSEEETQDVKWVPKPNLLVLAERTEAYLNDRITDEEWNNYPGLEIVWYDIFKNLRII